MIDWTTEEKAALETLIDAGVAEHKGQELTPSMGVQVACSIAANASATLLVRRRRELMARAAELEALLLEAIDAWENDGSPSSIIERARALLGAR